MQELLWGLPKRAFDCDVVMNIAHVSIKRRSQATASIVVLEQILGENQ